MTQKVNPIVPFMLGFIVTYIFMNQLAAIFISTITFLLCINRVTKYKFEHHKDIVLRKIYIPFYIEFFLELFHLTSLLNYYEVNNKNPEHVTLLLQNFGIYLMLVINAYISFVVTYICDYIVLFNFSLGLSTSLIFLSCHDIYEEWRKTIISNSTIKQNYFDDDLYDFSDDDTECVESKTQHKYTDEEVNKIFEMFKPAEHIK